MKSIEFGNMKPLARFPVIATSRVEEAEFCLSQSLTDVQVNRVDDRSNFRLELNAVELGCTSLIYNYFETRTTLTTVHDNDHVILVTGFGIPIRLFLDGDQFQVTSENAAMVTPCKQIQIDRPAHSEILYLRVPLSDLRNHFEKLTARHHRGSLDFERAVSVERGPGVVLMGLMHHLVNAFTFSVPVMKIPSIRKSYDELLLTAMLSLPHNKIDLLYENRSITVAPAIVVRAEDYMRAHFKKPITISDLVQVCDCSRSVLFSAFRKTRGYTPIEFLTEQRLSQAHEQLLKADYHAAVSSIALNCGFMSFSWFSRIYKNRFGERPSDTLRNFK